MRFSRILLVALPILAAPEGASGAPAQTSAPILLNINIRLGATVQSYATVARVVSFPRNYNTRIVYVGGRRGFEGTYNGLRDAVASSGAGLVMNGGFYTNDPSSPEGLLLVRGRVMSPFNFSQSATLCVDHSGKLAILPTSGIRSNAGSIGKQCLDALQAYPIVVTHGANAIHPAELKLASYTRSLIGLKSDGSIVAVFFEKPVHLYAAAEFMRAMPSSTRKVQVTGEAGAGAHASSGLGLVEAVNLSGDVDSFAAVNGTVLVGNINREIPSAIVIK